MTDPKYSSIYISGFRATGKTTISLVLAKTLGWELVDIDEIITLKSGKSINELTKNGQDWYKFRQLEHDTLTELLNKQRIVVSTGGGTLVNNIIENKSRLTFGQLNSGALLADNKSLLVVLTANEATIEERMRNQEKAKADTMRPILNASRARQVQDHAKEQLIDEIVKDSLETLKEREPLYQKLTDHIIDTGKLSIDESVQAILDYMQ